jgi:GPH family glycoside/pentoside/hexuronide:cation symporter
MKKQIGNSQIFSLVLGFCGNTFLVMLISQYIIPFFQPTEDLALPLLVPAGIIGVVQSLVFIFDCLIDPFIALKGDNSKNPKGRRIPLMKMSFIPAVIFCVLVFFAPVDGQSWLNVAWVVVAMLAYSAFRSFYDVNQNALVPELIPDLQKRNRYFAVRSFFSGILSMLMSMVPATITIIGGIVPSQLTAWRMTLSIFMVFCMILMAVPVLFIKESDYVTYQESEKRVTILESLKQTLSIREFQKLIFGMTFYDIAVGIATALLIYIVTLLLGLSLAMTTMLMLVIGVGQLLCLPLVHFMTKKIQKKSIMLVGIVWCAAAFLLIYFYEPLGRLLGEQTVQPGGVLEGMAGEGALVGNFILLLLIGACFIYPSACGGMVGASMFSDMALFDKVKTGRSSSGMFMAVLNLTAVIKQSIVPAIAGAIIYVGSTDGMPAATGVQAAMIVALVLVVPTFFCYYSMNEKMIKNAIANEGKEAGAKEENGGEASV